MHSAQRNDVGILRGVRCSCPAISRPCRKVSPTSLIMLTAVLECQDPSVRASYNARILTMPRKNPHAVALGRAGGKKGGAKGGKTSAARMTPEERRERARKAALARWKKWTK